MAQRGIDMTGWIMSEHGIPDSRWKVISLANEKIGGQLAWNCECSCLDHTKKIIAGGELRRGKTKSCGCYRKELMAKTKSKKDEVLGKTFGDLTILEDTGERSSSGSIIYKCSCSCGNNNYLIAMEDLTKKIKNGWTHCGNGIHQIQNIAGQTFGYLEVIKIDNSTVGLCKDVKWFCKCTRCNRDTLVSIRGADLKSGKTKTCGCGHAISLGAEKVLNILSKEANSKVVCEYSFKDLLSDKNRPLRFDFYLEELNILIEYDGEQHFYYQDSKVHSWNNSKEEFLKRKERDNLKNEYCIKNNIPLYRIPYTDIKDINKIQDILQEKYLINNK